MSLIGDIILPTSEDDVYPYTIDNSALFDGSTDKLARTPSVAGNDQVWTFRTFLKTARDEARTLLSVGSSTDNYTEININNGGGLAFVQRTGGSFVANYTTPEIWNDSSGHYDIVVAVDTTQAVAADRVKFFINGTQLTSTDTAPAQNLNTFVNTAVVHNIMGRAIVSSFTEGYVSDTYIVDGTQLNASTWGEESAIVSGLWIPKDPGSLTYGTNGCHLNFSNALDLGEDAAGSNDWTVNGTPVQTSDTPTNNYCTLAEFDNLSTGTLSGGNLTVSGGNAKVTHRPTSGQWYYEKDGVGVSYDADVSGQFDPTLTAGTYNFGGTSWVDTGPTGSEKAINASNFPSGDYVTSGSYTGNGGDNFVYTGCALTQLVISGGGTYDNDGTDSAVVEFYANGFKMVSNTDNVNTTSYNWSGTLKYPYKTSNAQSN